MFFLSLLFLVCVVRVVLREGDQPPNEGTFCTAEEGKTRQEFKAESDINNLMKRGEAAIVPQLREGGFFADISNIGPLHDCLEKVRRAGEIFAALPAQVRAAFDNRPELLTEAFDSPEGLTKLRDLGIVAPLPEVVLDQQEAAAESRATLRREVRERQARVRAAELPPPLAGTQGKGS